MITTVFKTTTRTTTSLFTTASVEYEHGGSPQVEPLDTWKGIFMMLMSQTLVQRLIGVGITSTNRTRKDQSHHFVRPQHGTRTEGWSLGITPIQELRARVRGERVESFCWLAAIIPRREPDEDVTSSETSPHAERGGGSSMDDYRHGFTTRRFRKAGRSCSYSS
jgi:hypothetical protein